jgi:D-alanyl-D-alanine-carboxypeptidase/D-alanyl-D-alanine-endopeptidase
MSPENHFAGLSRIRSVGRASCCLAAVLATTLICLLSHAPARAAGPATSPATRPAAQPARAEVDRLVRPLIDAQRCQGLVVAVVAGGETRFYGYGKRSAGDPAVPDERTVYEIGSVTKVFTGLLLAEAVGDGSVALNDPAQKHLPAGVHLPDLGGQPITLAHLTTHRSGLPRMPSNFHPKVPTNPYADYTVEQMYDFLNEAKPARKPDEGFEYSNLGTALLGHVLALKAGKSYEALVTERICAPLGMTETRLSLTDEMKGRLAPPHDADLEPASNWDLPTFAGAGGLRSTAKDMAAFVAAQLDPDPTPIGKAIRRSHARLAEANGPNDIAMNWHIDRARQTWWHNGQTGGYHSFAAFRPTIGAGVVVLTNTSDGAIDGVGLMLLRSLGGERADPPKFMPVVEVPAKTLDRYVGRYLMPPGLIFTITRDEGRLSAQLVGQPRLRLYPVNDRAFRYRTVDAQVTFDAEGEAPAQRLILKQNGREFTAGRIEENR